MAEQNIPSGLSQAVVDNWMVLQVIDWVAVREDCVEDFKVCAELTGAICFEKRNTVPTMPGWKVFEFGSEPYALHTTEVFMQLVG